MIWVWFIILLIGVVWILFILSLFFKMNPKNIYYTLASLWSLLGMIISYWTSLTTAAWNMFPQANYTSYAQCEISYTSWWVQKPATEQEKQACINQQNIYAQESQNNNIINSRRTIFEWLIWGFIFTLVFVFHYPYMKRS